MSENKIGPATEPKTKRWQLSGAFRDQKKTFKKQSKIKRKRLPKFKKKNLRWRNKSGGGKIRAGTAARSTWAGLRVITQ